MIPVCEPALEGRELQYVRDCLETNWISSAGKYINLFEEKFAAYCGARYGIACSSGTTAIHLAMVALGIGPGDEVIIPDFTLIVSANMVILAGARRCLWMWMTKPGVLIRNSLKLKSRLGPKQLWLFTCTVTPAIWTPSWP